MKLFIQLLTGQNMYAIMYIIEVIPMINTNATNFRKNMFSLLEQTVKFNEPITVSTKDGNAVLISEEDYNGLMETLYLSSIPGMKEKIVEGLKTHTEECIPESEVQW